MAVDRSRALRPSARELYSSHAERASTGSQAVVSGGNWTFAASESSSPAHNAESFVSGLFSESQSKVVGERCSWNFEVERILLMRATTIGVNYRSELHRYLLRRLPRARVPDDFSQALYVRLLRIDPVEGARDPLAHLYAEAANVVADLGFARAEHQQGNVTAYSEATGDWENDPDQVLPGDMAVRMNLQSRFSQALAEMPPLQASALVLCYQESLTNDEIAARLGLTRETVDEYLTRAKARSDELIRALLGA